MQGNQATTYLVPFTAYVAFMRDLERTLSTAQASCKEAMGFIDAKAADLKRTLAGSALAGARDKLTKLRPKAAVLQTKLGQLKMRIDEGKREHVKREEQERRRAEEKKDRTAAALVLRLLAEKMEAAEASLGLLEAAGAPLTSLGESEPSACATPVSARSATEAAHGKVSALVAEAKACLGAHAGKVAKAVRGPWHEAKQEMAKLKQRVERISKSAASISASVDSAYEKLLAEKLGQVSAAIRDSVQQRASTTESLFAELAGASGDIVTQDAFRAYVASLPALSLAEEHQQMLFAGAGAGGIRRRAFLGMLERYYKCVKDIAITTDFDIRAGANSTLRKLESSEVVEVLEGPVSDAGLGVIRVRARALSDGLTGWVTLMGNQGTPFLLETDKPCLLVAAAVPLQDACASEGGKDIRTLRSGEVVEVLEGPRLEGAGSAIRARGKATLDGATGWFTIKSRQGEDCAQPGRSTYTCTTSIALTDGMSISDCSVLRKIDKGEAMQLLEGPIEDETSGVMRIRAKSLKDGAEGWVTTRGNAGSVYVAESDRHYVVLRATPLHNACRSDTASTVRMLAEQESIELLEGPREEQSDPAMCVRACAVADGAVGWLTLHDKALKPWSPNYRCVVGTPLSDALGVETAKKLRQLEPGELIELLDGPREDAASGALRLHGRAAKDGVEGWATVAGSQGQAALQCLPAKR